MNDKTCKNCRFWHDKRTCDRIDPVDMNETETYGIEKKLNDDDSRVEWRTADDHGLNIEFVTGPDFGCIKFEPVKPKPKEDK